MMERAPLAAIDSDARERIAELAGRLSAHERHCDERHANLREFMAQIERETERIHSRLSAIWRWIMSVLVLLIVTVLGLIGNVVTRILIGT
jgi:hypothetical protein